MTKPYALSVNIIVKNADGLVGSTESESPNKRIVYLVLEGSAVNGEVQLSDEHQDFLWAHPSELHKADICRQFKLVVDVYAYCSNKRGMRIKA
jgi:hypothetical protein